jgi:hypothetical protein
VIGFLIVIAGLDPAIHTSKKTRMMDARVKPAHDELGMIGRSGATK